MTTMDNSISLFDGPSQPSFLIGKVITTFFASADNFYKVLLVQPLENSFDWTQDEIVVTGNFGEINEENAYRFEGKLVDHPKYGQQFQSDNYHNAQPTTKEGLINYLSGEQFTGIGKKTATKIVNLLGTSAIDQIGKDTSVLTPLHLRPSLVKVLIDNITQSQGMDQIIIGLNDFGFGSSLATTIFEKYRDETLEVIAKNPYQLAEDIDGISFKKADQVAEQIHINNDDPRRINAAILQVLDVVTMQSGDTYTTAKPLLTEALQLLEDSRNIAIAPQKIADQLVELTKLNKLVAQDNRIYPSPLFNAEWQIAQHLYRLVSDETIDIDTQQLNKVIRQIEKQLDIDYDASQEQAIKSAIKAHVFLLTGGPGTGKTTIINGIVAAFAKLHHFSLDINEYKDTPFPVLLAAPTGRAAKRMSETTGLPASTIHRLLGLNGREQPTDMNVSDLAGALLIVDELSMVDTLLFKTLLKAVPSSMQVVLVGDKDQLPSVGPGQIFHDLLNFNHLPKQELNQIYRQSAESSIIPLAHAIKLGKLPVDFTSPFPDRSFIACRSDQVADVIKQVVERAKGRGFNAAQTQVLAPMYRGNAGINRLNELVQDVFNPLDNAKKKEVEFRGEHFRIGDKVLHLVNSPENNVFNGDIGTIVSIELGVKGVKGPKTDQITIEFDQTEVTYARNEWQRLTLAYCISIHKSQGSQFEMVILPMVRQYNRMLQRNLLYTAITRAKAKLVLLGDPEAFARSVKNESVNRNTSLQLRLQEVFQGDPVPIAANKLSIAAPQEAAKEMPVAMNSDKEEQGPYILTMQLVQNGQVDPMIGMHGSKPTDF